MPINKELLRKIALFTVAGLALLSLVFWSLGETGEVGASLLKLYLVLFGMIGMAYWLLRFIKKSPDQNNSHRLKVTERLSLEPSVGLYLVEAQDKAWLIGVGGKRISLLDNWRLSPEESESSNGI